MYANGLSVALQLPRTIRQFNTLANYHLYENDRSIVYVFVGLVTPTDSVGQAVRELLTISIAP